MKKCRKIISMLLASTLVFNSGIYSIAKGEIDTDKYTQVSNEDKLDTSTSTGSALWNETATGSALGNGNIITDGIVKYEESSMNICTSNYSDFTIRIPKYFNMDTNNMEYKIEVRGNLTEDEILYIVPSQNILFENQRSETFLANVYQDKTSWTYDDLDDNYIEVIGRVDIEEMDVGYWTGILDFEISLELIN